MATMHLLREIHNICTWEHDQGEKWDVKQFAKLHFDLRGEARDCKDLRSRNLHNLRKQRFVKSVLTLEDSMGELFKLSF